MKEVLQLLSPPMTTTARRISTLVTRLNQTEKELQTLTGGGVDAVVNGSRTPYLLREAQEKLRASETRLRSIIAHEPECVKVVSLDGRLLDMNPAGLRMIEADQPETVLGQQVAGLVHPEDRDRFLESHRRVCEGEDSSLQFRLVGLKGTLRWMESHATPMRDGAGRIESVLSITRDVTQQRLAEAERDRLFNQSLDMLCVGGFDGYFKQLNPAWTACLGWTVEELLARPWIEFVHPEDREATICAGEHIADAGQPVKGFENRYRCKDGSYRWLSWSNHPLALSQKMFAVARDVTGQKLAQEKIAEQAALLDQTNDSIIVRDLQHRIRYWNQGATRLFGWQRDEALGKSVIDLFLINPKDFSAAFQTVLREGAWSGELEKRTQDGKTLTLQSRWTLVRDEAGKSASILAIETDITEKKKIEQQFLRAQRMESIGTLAGGIAHDLNNMLAPVMMAIGLLKMKFPDHDGAELLQTIQDSIQRGADLVKQVLSFSRGVASNQVQISLRHLTQEIQKVVQDTFPKSINFELAIARDLWTVKGDPTQLHQVLLNLCVNARDAMPQGGSLKISLQNETLDEVYAGMSPEKKSGKYVLVQVADSGTGIPPDVRERIFEPFFTTKEFGKGTGLGLSTTLGIVKSHGGFIDLETAVNCGTTFKIFLPVSQTAAVEEILSGPPVEFPSGNGETVLVVDDEESIRRITQKILESFGYHVLAAGNGVEAISTYVRHRNEIKVVLTDMAMPIMAGPALIVSLKTINPAIKIIGSSGLSSKTEVTQASGMMMESFIQKPYKAEILLRTLREVLQAKEDLG